MLLNVEHLQVSYGAIRALHGIEPAMHPDYLALVAALNAHFCPNDPVWRRQVLQRARQVIDRALEGLQA